MDERVEHISIDERKQIVVAYQQLLRVAGGLLESSDIKLIRRAIEISIAEIGFKQRVKGRLSVVHSLEAAKIIVSEIGLGRTSLICTLLYDTIQYSDNFLETVKKQFGTQVANILEGLVKVNDLYQRNVSVESENFRKLLLTFAQDVRVILIIIADRLLTMRTLDLFQPEMQLKIAYEVSYLYAPMAHRLGLYSIKSEMEDLVMKYTNNEMYKFIAKKLNETKRAREKYINEFIAPLKLDLQAHNLKFDIKGRTKTIYSIFNKMQKQNVEFEQVYDLFAIRIILDSKAKDEKADCWRVYSILADKYQPNPSRMRDWLSVPKSNGYESLHTTVLGPENKWVEVQIRSRRMNDIAERGLAAHWKYKGLKGDRGLDTWLSNIREILDNPELNAKDFIDDFKLNLYEEEVFVFTPKGDLRRFPKGSTVLDFAFDIHTEVGKKCLGAKVNDKNVSIRYVLQNGDQVAINTSTTQEPKQDWLKYVVTSRAKTKLKQALREIHNKEAELGKELLIRRLKNWKLELNDQLTGLMVKHFKFKNTNEFFRDIALEKIDLINIKEYIIQYEKSVQEREHSEHLQGIKSAGNFIGPSHNEELHDGQDVLLIDKNLTNVDYKLAKCCNPIFGDEIFGFVSVSGGIRIHRKSCPNARDLHTKFFYRIIKAGWTGEAEANYLVAIKVVGEDDIGIISNVSQLITKEFNLKIRAITVDSKEGLFEGTISIFVNNIQILNTLKKKISEVKGVISATRIDAVQ